MTTRSNDVRPMTPAELESYGFARARDIAFDAVMSLLRRREAAGVKDRDIAKAIGWSPSRFSRSCRGPANWTLRTLGALVVALDGELEITVRANEDPLPDRTNYDAYDGYRPQYRNSDYSFIEQSQKRLQSEQSAKSTAQARAAGLPLLELQPG